jgi:Bacterial SH3 domain
MRLITSLIFVILATNAYAINDYNLGDNLFIWAKNGLNIRKDPNSNSPIVGKLSFGKKIIVIDENLKRTPFSLEINKIKELENNNSEETIKEKKKSKNRLIFNGFWVKIRFNNIEGYVFDAYLSTLKPLSNDKNTSKKGEDYDEHYELFKINFGLIKQKGLNLYNKNSIKDVSYFFNQGAEIHTGGGPGGYWGKSVKFPTNISLIEGYLIFEAMMTGNNESIIFISNSKIKIEVSDGEIIIEIIKGKLVISEDHAC